MCEDANLGNISLIFAPKNMVYRLAEKGHDFNGQTKGTYPVDWSKKPHYLDVDWGPGSTHKGILEFVSPNEIRIDSDAENGARPKAFSKNAITLTRRERPVAGTKQADADAQRDLGIAEYYRRMEKFGSAHFYYELTCRRYPEAGIQPRRREGLKN